MGDRLLTDFVGVIPSGENRGRLDTFMASWHSSCTDAPGLGFALAFGNTSAGDRRGA